MFIPQVSSRRSRLIRWPAQQAKRFVGGLTILATVTLIPLLAAAGPRIVEESARLAVPDSSYIFPLSVAVDGDWIIATGMKDLPEQGSLQDNSAWLYQRQANGSWTLVRRLLQYLAPSDGDEPLMIADAQGGVAVILKENASWIFERSGASWVAAPSPINTDGMDVEVNGGTIVVSSGTCDWTSNAYRKGTNGAWALVRQTEPQPDEFCENEDERGEVDVSGNAVIVYTWGNDAGPPSARIFEGPYGSTPTLTRLVAPSTTPYVLTPPAAIDLPSAIVSGEPANGMYSFTRDGSGIWNRTASLLRPDNLAVGPAITADVRGGLAALGQPADALHGVRSGSVSVFQRNANGSYKYVARLLTKDRDQARSLGFRVDVSGRRVASGSIATQSVYVFDLPTDLTSPATIQDTFEDGNASDWTPQAGSSFTVASASSRVYRQSSTTGNAASIWNNTDRTHQSISADIKATAFATTTGDKWFGLVTRHIDANNYYYVTLRNNNTALLRKMSNGVFTTLASAPLTVSLNRPYRVRLEAVGVWLRLFVDDQLLAEARDETHSHGQAGVMMYKTRADYDNIVVSANPRTTLARYQFSGDSDSRANWETLGTWTTTTDGLYSQSDLTSGARAIGGIATDDQVIQTRVRRLSGAGANNWFGLAARYRDAGNYYYVTFRNDGSVSLRKLVNNAIVDLDSAPFTSSSNVWYRIRLEAIGNQLRVYINDALYLEATDTSHATGRYGPVMYKTAAQYDDFEAIQP